MRRPRTCEAPGPAPARERSAQPDRAAGPAMLTAIVGNMPAA